MSSRSRKQSPTESRDDGELADDPRLAELGRELTRLAKQLKAIRRTLAAVGADVDPATITILYELSSLRSEHLLLSARVRSLGAQTGHAVQLLELMASRMGVDVRQIESVRQVWANYINEINREAETQMGAEETRSAGEVSA